MSPSTNFDLDMEIVATNGTIAVYASETFGPEDPEILRILVRVAMTKNVRFQFILTYTIDDAAKDAAVEGMTLAAAAGLLATGAEHGLTVHRFPLERTAEAHRASERGVLGKVPVDVSGHGTDER